MDQRAVQNGAETWPEWGFLSEEDPRFWQRGVVIAVVADDVIASARFYIEPVDMEPVHT